MKYALDVYTLCRSLIPSEMRNLKNEAWVKSLLQPIQTVVTSFSTYSNALRYDLSINGQVMYLEKALNDKYDPIQRRIYIDDPLGTSIVQPVIFNKSEKQPSLVVWNKSENQTNNSAIYNKNSIIATDFVVFIPVILNIASINIGVKNIVNRYKIAGKKYLLNYF
jgi:hypothetical protein